MKKVLIVITLLSLIGFVGWQNRVNLLMIGVPILLDLANPISEESAVNWSKGPEESNSLPSERPPNIILILADDMGFNDLSLYITEVLGMVH